MHEKHPKLLKPGNGMFHQREFAIMGLPCGEIKQLAQRLIAGLPHIKLGYVDADHKPADGQAPGYDQFEVSAAALNFVDKIAFEQVNLKVQSHQYQLRRHFDQMDGIIINGNHFTAEAQILVLDSRKPVEKKLEKITNPVLIVTTDALREVPQAIVDKFSNIKEIPKIHLSESATLIGWFARAFEAPMVCGLILAGGKSTRMQQDKAAINYHGKPQVEHLQHLMQQVGIASFVSKRQQGESSEDNVIFDSFTDLGPYGAILSAFRQNPTCAWLVVACDLPLVSVDTLLRLLEARDQSKVATAYFNEATGFPDPLITLWEPKAYPLMLHFLSMGYSCPRKVLINSDIKMIQPQDPKALMNANTPEEADKVHRLLGKTDH